MRVKTGRKRFGMSNSEAVKAASVRKQLTAAGRGKNLQVVGVDDLHRRCQAK